MTVKRDKKSWISVIVPAYNEEAHIDECLVSIKKQTYKKIELIVIDDGSVDNTKKIASKYADVLLVQKHQGPGVARNKAATIAKGEILVFVDADMYLDKNFVKSIVEPIFSKKAQATFTNEEFVANKENIWAICANIDNDVPQGLRMKKIQNFSAVARAIKKNIFFQIGGINPKLGYGDDHIFSQINSYEVKSAKGAICYHYNPETLQDVYLSARWIGRNPLIEKNLKSIIRYSPINSLINSMRKIKAGAPLFFMLYKVIFDFGVLSGIIVNNKKSNFAK